MAFWFGVLAPVLVVHVSALDGLPLVYQAVQLVWRLEGMDVPLAALLGMQMAAQDTQRRGLLELEAWAAQLEACAQLVSLGAQMQLVGLVEQVLLLALVQASQMDWEVALQLASAWFLEWELILLLTLVYDPLAIAIGIAMHAGAGHFAGAALEYLASMDCSPPLGMACVELGDAYFRFGIARGGYSKYLWATLWEPVAINSIHKVFRNLASPQGNMQCKIRN